MRTNVWTSISLFPLLVLGTNLAFAEHLESFTEPYQRIAVPAPEVGVIAEILVEEGDQIVEGQTLAKLDDTVLRASLEVARSAKEAKGALNSAENELKMQVKRLESYQELHERGNATQRELDRAENEYHQAASRLQSVREDLEVRRLEYERVRAQLDQRVIQSRIDGFVITVDKEVGEFVSPTDPTVMHVVHLNTLKAVFSVPLELSNDLRSGQTVSLEVGYERLAASGVIESVSPVADAESGTRRVKIRIPNQAGEIPSGVTCRWDTRFEVPVKRTSRTTTRNRSIQ